MGVCGRRGVDNDMPVRDRRDVALMKPYGYLIDDSATYQPYFTRDADFAQQRAEAGKSVTPVYTREQFAQGEYAG